MRVYTVVTRVSFLISSFLGAFAKWRKATVSFAVSVRLRPLSGSRDVAWRRMDGRTDRRDEANSHFPQISERAKQFSIRRSLTAQHIPTLN